MLLSGCLKEEELLTKPDIDLRFSADTLFFDTTFTTIGSATRVLKIFNHENAAIQLSKISVKGTQGIHFNFNVDGKEGPVAENIRIESKDSIYLFCRVRVDPDQPLTVSPFVLEDKLVIEVNQTLHEIPLIAWGQNANYITGKSAKAGFALLSCNMQQVIWNDPKPYVIFGTLIVDSCELVIPAGAKVYFHGGLVRPDNPDISPYTDGRLFIINQGKLTISGTTDQKVLITGDRLERQYADIPGQWGGIAFQNYGKTNQVSNLDLRNAGYGLYVDSTVTLLIDHSRVINTASSSIIGRQANIRASNCQFTQAGAHNVYMIQGGQLDLSYCTMHNDLGRSYALYATNFKCTRINPSTRECIEGITLPVDLKAVNCIFSGTDNDEVFLVDRNNPVIPDRFRYQFSHSYIQGDSLQHNEFRDHTIDCIFAMPGDRLYRNENQYDFSLDSASVVLDKGISLQGISDDLIGQPRHPVTPDQGALEKL